MNTNHVTSLLTTQQADVVPQPIKAPAALRSLEGLTDEVKCALLLHDARVRRQALADPASVPAAVVVNAAKVAAVALLPRTMSTQVDLLEAKDNARHRNMNSYQYNGRAMEDHHKLTRLANMRQRPGELPRYMDPDDESEVEDHKLTRLANMRQRPGELPRYMDPDDESEVEDEQGPRIFPNTKGQARRLNLQQLQQLQQFYDAAWVPNVANAEQALAVGRRRFMKFLGTSG
eukprot:CAMPEP_0202920108 /NCGR_PEP_ID=MMETSP1392-20130828/76686_1 /ASSEMBLY_ACC=CAM_ASM_000868 /TAXON_ID=225041 /ORGANISM="Chlamydomonas chlamydogama, Strain SAG 11-48b" /LENGTH=231 /DNA_ID=CAMNT_0049613591 /DNA_START=47 /DNA_END=742 /DNA_ORIENTATION=-